MNSTIKTYFLQFHWYEGNLKQACLEDQLTSNRQSQVFRFPTKKREVTNASYEPVNQWYKYNFHVREGRF